MGGGAASTRAAGAEGFLRQPPRRGGTGRGPACGALGTMWRVRPGTLGIGELVVEDLEERLRATRVEALKQLGAFRGLLRT